MKTVGITAEYNPFHKGHMYHIAKARQLSGAECVIACMSGDFTQRGEPAVCSKWERARAAAGEGGADLILELPFAFACSRAPVFAAGAVDMLVCAGADAISFGCEAEYPELLQSLAQTLMTAEDSIEEDRVRFMKEGASSAKAYELAVRKTAGDDAAELLLSPNNILAIEYMKRILLWRSKGKNLDCIPVRRHGSGYGEVSEKDGYAGGGALRRMIEEGKDIRRFIPSEMSFADPKLLEEKYLQLLKGILIRSTPEEIAGIYGVGEGMENAILKNARETERLEDLVQALTSRRYTQATVRRALTHILLGTGWEEIDALTEAVPSAGRLLAAKEPGRRFLRERSSDDFRIITNMNKEAQYLSPSDMALLELDERAADLYNLLLGKELYGASDRVMSPYIE